MSIHKIGFLHPGEMGISLVASALNSGQQVYWCSDERSQASHDRVEQLNLAQSSANAGTVQHTDSLDELCQSCNIIIAVCPPHAAITQAKAVIGAGFKGIYTDVNAISPQTANTIAEDMSAAEIDFVDGGIIGLPPTKRNTTWLYLAGTKAEIVAQCFAQGPLETTVLSSEPGQASALKMCFAANSKGVSAMLTAILGAAEHYGVREALERQWDIYNPELAKQGKDRIQTVARKAWRFEGEMEEIAATLKAAGMPDGFHLAAADIYSRQGSFKDGLDTPTLETIIRTCLDQKP